MKSLKILIKIVSARKKYIFIIIIYRVPYKQKLKMNKDNQYNQITKCKWIDKEKKFILIDSLLNKVFDIYKIFIYFSHFLSPKHPSIPFFKFIRLKFLRKA